MIPRIQESGRSARPYGYVGPRGPRDPRTPRAPTVIGWNPRMPRSKLSILLGLAAWLACASAPRIEHGIGTARSFSPADRFAPASVGLLATENPDFDEPALENLQELLEKTIGWHGLTLAPDDAADWLVSCAFRKRLVWKSDISREPVTEPWHPHPTRV